MGIDESVLRFLLDARRAGVDYTTTLCIGRQQLFLTPERLRGTFSDFDLRLTPAEANAAFADPDLQPRVSAHNPQGPFADNALRHLGVRTLDSLDASGFEGATVVADMNQPLDPHLESRY